MVAVITAPGLGLERNSGSLLGSAGQLGSASVGQANEQIYVNAASGNLIVQATDAFLMGAGPDTAVTRTYNSQGAWPTYAWQWSSQAGGRIANLVGTLNAAGSYIDHHTADGAVVTYSFDTSRNAYVANENGGAYDTLTYSAPNNQWTWTDGDTQTTEVFASGTYLSAITDNTGVNQTTINTWNGVVNSATNGGTTNTITSFLNTSLYDPSSGMQVVETQVYGEANHTLDGDVIEVSDQMGRLVEELTYTDPQHIGTDPSTYYTNYTYDPYSGLLTSINQQDGSQVNISYDSSNRVHSVTQSLATGVATTQTFAYNTNTNSTTVTDGNGASTTLFYDGADQLTGVTTAIGSTEGFTYDPMGDLATVAQNGVQTHAYTYDSNGNQLTDTDAVGDEIVRTYSSTNQLLTETQYTGTGTTGTALTTTYVYNTTPGTSSYNQLAFVISPENEVTQYLYNGAAGEVTSVIGYDKRTPTGAAPLAPALSTTNNASNLSSMNAWAATPGFDKSLAHRTDYTYSAEGAVATTTDFSATSSTGVGQGPALQIATAFDNWGAQIALGYNGLSATGALTNYQQTTASYDGLHRLIQTTDSAGPTLTYAYGFDQVRVTNGSVGPYTTATISNDDLAGNPQNIFDEAYNAPTGVTSDTYDSLGRLRQTTDPDGVVHDYVYDAIGRKTADITGGGSITLYIYDGFNRVIGTIVHANKLTAGQLALFNTPNYSPPVVLSQVGPASSTSDVATYSIYDNAGRQIESIGPDGTLTTFTYDGASRLISQTVYAQRISASTVQGFQTVPPLSFIPPTATAGRDQTTKFAYDGDGRLIQTIADYGGMNLTTTTTYDAFGNVVAVKDPNLNTSRNIYNQANQLIYAIDANGDVTSHTYDTDNNLLSSIRYANPLAQNGTPLSQAQLNALPSEVLVSTILSELQPSVQGSTTTPLDNTFDTYTYDSNGRILNNHYTGQYAYDQVGNVDSITDQDVLATNPSGGVVRYAYDNNNRLIYTVDGAGDVTQNIYDAAGRVIQTIHYANKLTQTQLASLPASSPYAADMVSAIARDVTASSTNSDEYNLYSYDADGRLAFSVDAEDHLTEYDYNGQGQVVQTIQYAQVTNGLSHTLSTTVDSLRTLAASYAGAAANRVTRSVYNAAGELAYSINAEGGVTSYTYDAFGNLVQDIQFADKFSGAGVQTVDTMSTAGWASGGVHTTNTANRVCHYVFDNANRQIYSIDAAGDVTQAVYDANGNVVTSRDYAAAPITVSGLPTIMSASDVTNRISTSTADHVNRSVYDGAGRLIYSIDATGAVTRTVYDGDGKVVATIAYADRATTLSFNSMQLSATDVASAVNSSNPLNQITRYVYGGGGRLRFVIDATGGVTAMNWDNDSRLVSTQTYSETFTSSVLALTYDTVNNTVAAWNRTKSEITNYTYDQDGRQLTKTVITSPNATNPSLDQGLTTANTYDAFGNLVKVTDPVGASGYFYYNRLNQQTLAIDADGYATATSYSLGGQITSVTRYATATTGATATTRPTITTSSADETTTIGRDDLDRVISTTDALGNTQSYVLDVFGDQTTVTNALGGVTTNLYNQVGQLTSSTVSETAFNINGGVEGNTNLTGVNTTYRYDSFGNRIYMGEAYGLAEQRNTTYTYDAMNRLIGTAGDVLANSYSPTQGWGTFANQTSTTYDAFGNVIMSVDANGGKTYTYHDDANRKIAQVSPTGTLSTWGYDSFSNATVARVYGDDVAPPTQPGGSPPPPFNASNYRETDTHYDLANRQVGTTIANVLVGAFTNGFYGASFGITTATSYDADGNVATSTDGDGNISHFYYDADGRLKNKTDGAGSVTAYTYNSDGNVLTETQYALVNSSPTAASGPTDRVTQFTYDKNGNRTSETRLGMTVSTGSGTGTTTASATVSYTYNALNEVLSKTEATLDTTQYHYDAMGRQTEMIAPGFVDYTTTTFVQPDTHYYYDGLNNLVRTTVGALNNSAIPNRVSENIYGAGGRLTYSLDADGNATDYYYDLDGAVVETSDERTLSNGQSVYDYRIAQTDVAGRIVYSTAREYNANTSTWTFGDATTSDYNAYGELADQNLNGVRKATYGYDGAGRLISSTANGGIQQYFINDANGNVTLEIDPTGLNFADPTISAQLMSYVTTGQANTYIGAGMAGSAYVSLLATTITTYDGHNQVLQVRKPQQQLDATHTIAALTDTKTYDAFGDVATDTDAAGGITQYFYNVEGEVVQEKEPTVTLPAAVGGTPAPVTPTLNYFYDISGRMVGSQDADGFLTTRTLLAGTGYDGSDAKVVTTTYPDASTTTARYNVFGDQMRYFNQLGNEQDSTYDGMDRLLTLTAFYDPNNTANPEHDGAPVLTTHYTYDSQGERNGVWNSELGQGAIEYTDYDMQGRVVKQTDAMQNATTYTYTIDTSSGTPGFGGTVELETNATGLPETITQDVQGRTIAMSDFGQNAYAYQYDSGGRLTQETITTTTGQTETITNGYFDTGQLASTSNSYSAGSVFTGTTSTFGYDAMGNRTAEKTTKTADANVVYENASSTYDLLNRMVSYSDQRTYGGTLGASQINNEAIQYDANGNVIHTITGYSNQGVGGLSQEAWFQYDSLNRMTISQGQLVGSVVQQGPSGVAIHYDTAGNRISADTATTMTYSSGDPSQPGGATFTELTTHEIETYSYSASGYLTEADITQQTVDPSSLTVVTGVQYTATYTRDALGRSTAYAEQKTYPNTAAGFSSSTVYNADGLEVSEIDNSTTSTGAAQHVSTIFDYQLASSGGAYNGAWDGGVVTHSHSTTTTTPTGGTATTVEADTVNTYTWGRNALETGVSYTPSAGAAPFTSTIAYDPSGALVSATVKDGATRTLTYVNNAQGQVLDRSENLGGNNNLEQAYFYMNGRQVGSIGNDGAALNYVQAIADRSPSPAADPIGALTAQPGQYAAFGDVYAPINPATPGQAGGSAYTVQSGDSLQTIAANLWGDASLWYLLADANGLSGSNQLPVGATLAIPSNVMAVHNNASTFTVYDPSKAIGNVQPTVPAPPPVTASGHARDCGVFGAVIEFAVAVVVGLATDGVGSAILGSLGEAVGDGAIASVSILGTTAGGLANAAFAAAAGSAAGQFVGLASGIQSNFSFSQVALAALSAGVAQGIGNVPIVKGLDNAITSDLASTFGNATKAIVTGVNSALGSVVTQGVAVAIGLQSKFDWAGVAAAGVEAGVTAEVGQSLPFNGPRGSFLGDANLALSGVAGLIAGAATRTLINGSDFGQNVITQLPQAIGQTIGEVIVDGINAAENPNQGSAQPTPTVSSNGSTPNDSSNIATAAAYALGASGDGDTIPPIGGYDPETEYDAYFAGGPQFEQWGPAKLVNGVPVRAGSDATGQAFFDTPDAIQHGSYVANPPIGTSTSGPIGEIVVVAPQAPNVGPLDTQIVAVQSDDVAPTLSAPDLDTSIPNITIDNSPAPASPVASPGRVGLDAIHQQLAQILGIGEGNYESYNTGTRGIRGGKVGHSFINPPVGTVTGRTINQVLNSYSLPATNPNRMFAVGAYQITHNTLVGAVHTLHLTGNERMTPELQDRIFRDYLVPHAGNGALGRLLNHGVGTVDQAQFAAAQQWASVAAPTGFPTEHNGISNGVMSYYGGPANGANLAETRALRALLSRITH